MHLSKLVCPSVFSDAGSGGGRRGKKAKSKLKDGRIRSIMRHPNITRSLSAKDEAGLPAPRYAEAVALLINRCANAARSGNGLFGGGGFSGMLPVAVGGFFFMYFNKNKGWFGGNRAADVGFNDAEMEREFENILGRMPAEFRRPDAMPYGGRMGDRPIGPNGTIGRGGRGGGGGGYDYKRAIKEERDRGRWAGDEDDGGGLDDY